MQMLLIRIGDVVYKGPRVSFFMLHTNTTRKRLAGPTKKAEEVLQYVKIFILLKRALHFSPTFNKYKICIKNIFESFARPQEKN